MSQRLPNLFVPGTQKSGTTYLCAQLARHPDVYISDLKEPMFFNSRNFDADNVHHYLKQHFSDAKDETWVGEGSTLYFQDERAPYRIRRAFGVDLKFIICLRHPVEKALSLYLHNYRRGRITGREKLTEMTKGPLAVPPRSLYAPSIERYLELFRPKQLKFMLYDQLVDDASAFVDAATSFLEIEPVKRISSSKINAGSPWVWEGGVLKPALKLDMQGKNVVVPTVDKEEIVHLQKMVLRDVEKTEKLIHQDLYRWKSLPDFDSFDPET